jgi:hypothetical protein
MATCLASQDEASLAVSAPYRDRPFITYHSPRGQKEGPVVNDLPDYDPEVSMIAAQVCRVC